MATFGAIPGGYMWKYFRLCCGLFSYKHYCWTEYPAKGTTLELNERQQPMLQLIQLGNIVHL